MTTHLLEDRGFQLFHISFSKFPINQNLNKGLQKSDNFQYNTLGSWDKRLIDQASDVPSTYYFFFIISCRILCKNLFNLSFYKFTKIKSFECPKSIRNYKKIIRTSDAWSTSHLSQQTSLLYSRLTNFKKLYVYTAHTQMPLA